MGFGRTFAKLVNNPDFFTFVCEKSGIFMENSRAVTTGGPHGAHGGPMGPLGAPWGPMGAHGAPGPYSPYSPFGE